MSSFSILGSLFLLTCFSVQPFFTFIISALLGLFLNTKSSYYIYIIIVLGSLYLGLINLTKIPESDLVNYLYSFNQAKNLNFKEFLILHPREPLYTIIVYILGNIYFLSDKHFLIATTAIPYVIFLVSVVQLSLHLNLRNRSILALVLLLLFFPQIFNISAHLVRQFIASSICFYVVSKYLTTGKRKVVTAIVAFFIHFFVSLFFFLIFIMRYAHSKRYPPSLTIVSSIFLLCISYFTIYAIVLNLPANILLFHAITSRIINPAGQIDFNPMGLSQYVFIITILSCAIYNLKGNSSHFRTINFKIVHRAIIAFCLLILISSFIPTFSEVTLRFSMLLYFASGLVLPYTLMRVNNRINTEFILIIFIPVVIGLFFLNSQFGTWQYANIYELLAYSGPEFWKFKEYKLIY